MRTFRVFLFAFKGNGTVRPVDVPSVLTHVSPKALADVVYAHGQNDVVPLPMRSVSTGDVIEVDEHFFRVDDFGFTEVTVPFRNFLKEQERLDTWLELHPEYTKS